MERIREAEWVREIGRVREAEGGIEDISEGNDWKARQLEKRSGKCKVDTEDNKGSKGKGNRRGKDKDAFSQRSWIMIIWIHCYDISISISSEIL